MTRQEKYDAIMARLKFKEVDFDGGHISAMVICGYLDDLSKHDLIESEYAVTPLGANVRAVCEEFDWKPDDEEVLAFVKEMVEPVEQPAFLYLIMKYRDDREELIQELKNSRDKGSES